MAQRPNPDWRSEQHCRQWSLMASVKIKPKNICYHFSQMTKIIKTCKIITNINACKSIILNLLSMIYSLQGQKYSDLVFLKLVKI